MSEYIGYLLAGIGGGAVIASLAIGLVLCHRTSGVVNFGLAAMGAYVAFAHFEFRETGDLVIPVLGLPNRFHLMTNPTAFSALLVSTVLAAVLGAVAYWLVFRPLRRSPALARVVASLGLMLYLQEMIRIRFPVAGSAVVKRRAILPSEPVHILGTVVTTNRLILAGFAIAAAGALWAVFRFTRFGLATRAAAGNEKGALLVGIPSDRVALVNWMVASVLTSTAVVFIEPIAGLDPTTTTLLVMPALAAALLGGLASFVVASVAGLGVGMLQSLILGYVVQPSTTWIPDWLPRSGLQQSVPVLLILVGLVWRGNTLPDRSAIQDQRLPGSPTPRNLGAWTIALAGSASAGLLTFDAAYRQALMVSMIFVLLALSVVVITGYVGQISLAQLAFAGVAGFSSIGLVEAGLPFPLAAILSASLAAAVGVLVALPAARVRGMSLAIATLAMAIAVEQLVLASEPLSGGIAGKSAPRPYLFGTDVGVFATGSENFRPAFGFVLLASVTMCCLAVANIRRNRTGLRWLAVRSNERAAAAAGIDVRMVKISAFAFSAFLAGLSGVFMAFMTTTLSTTSFMVIGALVAVSMTYLAGIAGVSGAIIAGAITQAGIFTVSMNSLTNDSAGEYVFATSGLMLMVMAIAAPSGISGLMRSGFGRLGLRS